MSLFPSAEEKAIAKSIKSLVKAAGLGKDAKISYGLADGTDDLIIEFTDKSPQTRAAHREGALLEATLEQAGIANENKPRIIPGTEDEHGRPDKTPAGGLVHIDGRSIRTLRIDTKAQGGVDALAGKLDAVAQGLQARQQGGFQARLQAERASASKGFER